MAEDFKLSKAKWQFIVQSLGIQAAQAAALRFGVGEDITRTGLMPYYSKFYTPVWDNVVLKDQATNPLLGLRIDSVLIDASLANVVKRTRITGRAGTVKEYITEDDVSITIRGALFGDIKDQYPEDMTTLINMCRTGTSLEIDSVFLNDHFKVYNIVVDSLRFAQRHGGMQKQAFELKAFSDVPYELEGDGLLSDNDFTYTY